MSTRKQTVGVIALAAGAWVFSLAAGPLGAQVIGAPGGAANHSGQSSMDPSQNDPNASAFPDDSKLDQAYKDYSSKNFSAAIPELKAVIQKSPKKIEAHKMLADIYLQQSQAADAVPELEAVTRLDPKDRTFRYNLGLAYLQVGDAAKAADTFAALQTERPKDADYAMQYAVALEKAGKHAEAAAAFERAAALKPKDSQAPFYAGMLYHQTGNDAKAVPNLKSALALGTTQKFSVYAALAEAAAGAKQNAEAVQYYTLAGQAKPDDFGVAANLGILQQNSGNKPEAEAAYRRAVTLKADPKSLANIQSNLAILLTGDGKLDDAAALLTQAAQADPSSVSIQNNLGTVYERQGKKDLALAAYKQALTLQPDNSVAKASVVRLSKP